MAQTSSTIQEELRSATDQQPPEERARLVDLEAEEESPFLRGQKRVSARRSPIPKRTAARLLWAVVAILVAAAGTVSTAALYHYGEHSSRFRLDSSDQLEIAGLNNVTHAQILEVMGGDIGRNVFFIPLEQRKKELEQIPWLESASVMRFAPNRLKIEIRERTPVAFARIGSKVMLVDRSGVLMDLPARKKYSFPVIVGMSLTGLRSTRSAQMKTFNQLIEELDSGGAHYSQELSEVDLSDPEDVKVLTGDREGDVLVHLGSSAYLERFKIYVAHLREWRQQFPKLESVDLRYDGQIIVNPDLSGAHAEPPLSSAAVKRAMAAGVKPSALINVVPAALSPAHGGRKPQPAPPLASAPAGKAERARTHPRRASMKAAKMKPAKMAARPGTKPVARQSEAVASQKPSPAIIKEQDSR